jgi:uncharacterized protein
VPVASIERGRFSNMSAVNVPELIISTFSKGLDVYTHILERAKEYAQENGLDVESFVEARLIEDQQSLAFQIDLTTKIVENNLGRLVGEKAAMEDVDLKTFEDMQTRIQQTIELLKSFDIEKARGKEGNELQM